MANAIIIAAGMGARLGALTEAVPKCLLPVGEQSILDYQLGALKANSVEDISIVKGHMAEKIDYPGLKSYLNDNYHNNNILCSLMYARKEMENGFIASYSDILYSTGVVKLLLDSPHDIAAVIDTDWQPKYEGRTQHPESEAEKAVVDATGRVLAMGKQLDNYPAEQTGEFIGLFKCSAKGTQQFCDAFDRARKEFAGKPFFNAKVFEKAYITDMMLYLISQDIPVHSVPITEQWMEIDTEQDLERARQWVGQQACPV